MLMRTLFYGSARTANDRKRMRGQLKSCLKESRIILFPWGNNLRRSVTKQSTSTSLCDINIFIVMVKYTIHVLKIFAQFYVRIYELDLTWLWCYERFDDFTSAKVVVMYLSRFVCLFVCQSVNQSRQWVKGSDPLTHCIYYCIQALKHRAGFRGSRGPWPPTPPVGPPPKLYIFCLSLFFVATCWCNKDVCGDGTSVENAIHTILFLK